MLLLLLLLLCCFKVMLLCMNPQVYTAKKAELVSKQSQLADRGAPTTIINLITASYGEEGGKGWEGYCRRLLQPICGQEGVLEGVVPISFLVMTLPLLSDTGESSPILNSTLLLGIALLKEGNQQIQDVSDNWSMSHDQSHVTRSVT